MSTLHAGDDAISKQTLMQRSQGQSTAATLAHAHRPTTSPATAIARRHRRRTGTAPVLQNESVDRPSNLSHSHLVALGRTASSAHAPRRTGRHTFTKSTTPVYTLSPDTEQVDLATFRKINWENPRRPAGNGHYRQRRHALTGGSVIFDTAEFTRNLGNHRPLRTSLIQEVPDLSPTPTTSTIRHAGDSHLLRQKGEGFPQMNCQHHQPP